MQARNSTTLTSPVLSISLHRTVKERIERKFIEDVDGREGKTKGKREGVKRIKERKSESKEEIGR